MSGTRAAAANGQTVDDHWCFGMPYRTAADAAKEHRHRASLRRWPLSAAVARPVGKKEIGENSAAKAAMDKEWNNLKEKEVWDLESVREWSSVAHEAALLKESTGKDVNFGYVSAFVSKRTPNRQLT